ncbi:unnamed protein product, partial [Ectocarpus sp. 12 AP-2014]
MCPAHRAELFNVQKDSVIRLCPAISSALYWVTGANTPGLLTPPHCCVATTVRARSDRASRLADFSQLDCPTTMKGHDTRHVCKGGSSTRSCQDKAFSASAASWLRSNRAFVKSNQGVCVITC